MPTKHRDYLSCSTHWVGSADSQPNPPWTHWLRCQTPPVEIRELSALSQKPCRLPGQNPQPPERTVQPGGQKLPSDRHCPICGPAAGGSKSIQEGDRRWQALFWWRHHWGPATGRGRARAKRWGYRVLRWKDRGLCLCRRASRWKGGGTAAYRGSERTSAETQRQGRFRRFGPKSAAARAEILVIHRNLRRLNMTDRIDKREFMVCNKSHILILSLSEHKNSINPPPPNTKSVVCWRLTTEVKCKARYAYEGWR